MREERQGTNRNITLQIRRANCSAQGPDWKNPFGYGQEANGVPGQLINYEGSTTARSGPMHMKTSR